MRWAPSWGPSPASSSRRSRRRLGKRSGRLDSSDRLSPRGPRLRLRVTRDEEPATTTASRVTRHALPEDPRPLPVSPSPAVTWRRRREGRRGGGHGPGGAAGGPGAGCASREPPPLSPAALPSLARSRSLPPHPTPHRATPSRCPAPGPQGAARLRRLTACSSAGQGFAGRSIRCWSSAARRCGRRRRARTRCALA